MTHLTEEHVAAYIGKGLTCKLRGSRKKYSLNGIRWGKAVLIGRDGITVYKPLPDVILCLRPLSQLTEVIEHNGEMFVPMEVLNREFPKECKHYGNTKDPNSIPYCIMKRLLSWHFDIFQLGDSGLAEPIPSIEQP
jgi:hypothetical protein